MMYWHIRGKNLTARDYAAAFLTARRHRAPTVGAASALSPPDWRRGCSVSSSERTRNGREAHRIAAELGAERELCIAAMVAAASGSSASTSSAGSS